MKIFIISLVFVAVFTGLALFRMEDGVVGQMPVIEVNAPRYSGEETDSVGMMPGVVIFADRPFSVGGSRGVEEFRQYRSEYPVVAGELVKFVIFMMAFLIFFIIGIIALVRAVRFHHQPVILHDKRNLLREYQQKYG